MLKNYLLVSLRSLLKNKIYSLINISGLAIGLACALVITLFLLDEFSYDRFHHRTDFIYRIVQKQYQNGEVHKVASTPAPMVKTLKNDFPEVLNICLLRNKRSGILQVREKTLEVPQVIATDQGFLDVFDFKLIRGNADMLFTDPGQIVVTDKVARSLFGDTWQTRNDLLGSYITYGKDQQLVLAGIIQEAPGNSTLQFDVILSFDPAEDGANNWFSYNYHTYIELVEGADRAAMDEKLKSYIYAYADPKVKGFATPEFYLQPLKDIYLHSDFDFHTDWAKTSSIVYTRVFLAVGLVILIIALFNFINLSTARAIRRAKEVGVRKTIGAYYFQLVAQFLTESVLITTIAVFVALVLVQFSLPSLNNIASKQLTLPLTSPLFMAGVGLFTFLMGLLAGAYPALYLSNFRPVSVLKGALGTGSGQRFRQVLVVAQFTLTIILVAATLIIDEQMNYMQDKELGFDKEQLIYLKLETMKPNDKLLVRDELRQMSSVHSASLVSSSLVDVTNSTTSFNYEGQVEGNGFAITRMNVDPDYFATTGMKVIAGRAFDAASKSDFTAFLINRTAATRMGWSPSAAVGKHFEVWDVTGTIIGVVEDFHFRPLTAAIEPLVFFNYPGRSYSGILIKAASAEKVIAEMAPIYKKYEPLTPLHYNFVDEELDRQYRLHETTGKLILVFSVFAIFVACLGLYGLVAFTTQRRTKEVGIRKVMGASSGGIILLLSGDFVLLVIISVVVACPIAYQLMSKWLEAFVYKVEVGWISFALAGIIATSIAGVTVLAQAIGAARMNPVDSLKIE